MKAEGYQKFRGTGQIMKSPTLPSPNQDLGRESAFSNLCLGHSLQVDLIERVESHNEGESTGGIGCDAEGIIDLLQM